MNKTEVSKILIEHGKWLRGEGGQRADLQDANLRDANLQRADLRGANLQRANLWGTNLWDANLQRANLQRADLDFSCWPLWCGSANVKVDKRLAAQLAAHFCVIDCSDKEYQKARKAVLSFAKQSHIAEELGLGNKE